MHVEEMQVRIRAYEIWEFEGCPHGRDLVHWFQAMSELDALAAATVETVAAVETVAPMKAKNAARKPKAASASAEKPKKTVAAKAKATPAAATAAKAPRRTARSPQVTLN